MTGLFQVIIIINMAVSTDGSLLKWHWKDMCGPEGLSIWSVKTKDLGICFQELCLQVPVLILLATLSAYYCGNQSHWVIRNHKHLKVLSLRAYAVTLMAVATGVKICLVIATTPESLQPVDYLLAAVEGVTWLVHLGYVIALRHRLGMSLRGPVSVCVLWTLNFVITALSLRSHVQMSYNISDPTLSKFIKLTFSFSILALILQCIYLLTLFPTERSWSREYEGFDAHIANSESQSLLGKLTYCNYIMY